jgi:hypothetical protein
MITWGDLGVDDRITALNELRPGISEFEQRVIVGVNISITKTLFMFQLSPLPIFLYCRYRLYGFNPLLPQSFIHCLTLLTSPYLKTTDNHYKNQLINAVYVHNLMKPINALCGQGAELLTFKTDGIYSYHPDFKA